MSNNEQKVSSEPPKEIWVNAYNPIKPDSWSIHNSEKSAVINSIGAKTHCYYHENNNPYRTACEAINKDNPMAVAENLELMVRYYSELLIVTESYKYGDLDVYNRLLSKIKSK